MSFECPDFCLHTSSRQPKSGHTDLLDLGEANIVCGHQGDALQIQEFDD